MPYTLAIPTQLTEEIKKSRFIVNAAPVTSAEQAAQFIDSISDPNATHNCWAWKIGQQYRFNDDGEPPVQRDALFCQRLKDKIAIKL